MDDALDVGARRVDGRVQLKAGDVDAEIRRALLDDVALHVGLDEARGRDLVVQQPVRIDEEVLLVLIEPGGYYAADALGPAVEVQQPEDRGELAAQQLLALRVAHALDSAYVVYRDNAIRVCRERRGFVILIFSRHLGFIGNNFFVREKEFMTWKARVATGASFVGSVRISLYMAVSAI